MTAATRQLTAVLFDMDGVLVDSTDAHVAAWTQFLEERGIPVPEGGVRSLFGRRAQEALAMLLDREPDAPIVRAALAELEGYATALLADHAPGERLVPGAPELIHELLGAGWKVAVGTSARRHVAEHALGALLPAFDVVVTAEDVSRGKPDPAVYLAAARRLAVPADACVVVEDAVAGVQAGVAAGMYVVAVPTTAPIAQLCDAGAERVLERVTDLPRLLAREGAVEPVTGVRTPPRQSPRGPAHVHHDR